MKDMNRQEFTVPQGAKAFTPGEIVPAAPAAKVVDTSHLVAGLDTTLGKAPEAAAPAAVVAEKQIVLSDDDKAAAERDAAKVIHNCPACGFRFDIEGEPVIADDVRRQWLRHILGEERFTQTYMLFDGALAVKFRTRTTAENDAIFAQLGREIADRLIPEAPAFASPAYIGRLYRYLLTASLVSIERMSIDADKPAQLQTFPVVTAENYPGDGSKDKRTPIEIAHTRVLSSMSESLVSALLNSHKRFEAVVSVLTTRSEDSDFWKPDAANI